MYTSVIYLIISYNCLTLMKISLAIPVCSIWTGCTIVDIEDETEGVSDILDRKLPIKLKTTSFPISGFALILFDRRY